MLQLEKIADGIYNSEAARGLSPTPNKMAGRSLQNTLGHAEFRRNFCSIYACFKTAWTMGSHEI